MTPIISDPAAPSARATAVLVLDDGTVFRGQGLGAVGQAVGEVCFNTSMTGYQEIMTDPSYAGQIVTFTFPHIGNVGANDEDIETLNAAGTAVTESEVLEDLKRRDERDMARADSPLKPAPDAYLLETTDKDIEAAFLAAVDYVSRATTSR